MSYQGSNKNPYRKYFTLKDIASMAGYSSPRSFYGTSSRKRIIKLVNQVVKKVENKMIELEKYAGESDKYIYSIMKQLRTAGHTEVSANRLSKKTVFFFTTHNTNEKISVTVLNQTLDKFRTLGNTPRQFRKYI